MNVWLLVPICLGGMALLMAVSHGAQELVLHLWSEIEGAGSAHGEDVKRSRRERLVHGARVAALLMAVVFLVGVVLAAKVAEDKVRSIPPSQALQDVEDAELDTINDSVLPDWRQPVPTWTPAPMSEELREALRGLSNPNGTTPAPATQP